MLDVLLGLYFAGTRVSISVSSRFAILVMMAVVGAAAGTKQVHPASLVAPLMEEGSLTMIPHRMNSLHQTKSPNG